MLLFKSLGWSAENGDVRAQVELGLMCLKGEGVRQDIDMATQWFRKAAYGGSQIAQHYLTKLQVVGQDALTVPAKVHDLVTDGGRCAVMVQNASGTNGEMELQLVPQEFPTLDAGRQYGRVSFTVKKDGGSTTHKVGAWYRFAAEMGNASGQYYYGASYDQSDDFSFAYPWYCKAAKQGHAKALFRLGRMYHHGNHVQCDLVLAHFYYNLAYLAGSLEGKEARDGVARHFNRFQQEEAGRLARNWSIGDPLPESSETGTWSTGADLHEMLGSMEHKHE